MTTTIATVPDLLAEQQIRFLKEHFSKGLEKALNLHLVFAPLFVRQDTGINDDLNGTETPVTFTLKESGETYAIVHSLAKWKRLRLAELGLPPYEGILTHMMALRPEETLSPLHSVLVDQWDWEMIIPEEDRHLDTLKATVRKIYGQLYATAQALEAAYPGIVPTLPEQITFLHTEDLHAQYPDLPAKMIEHLVTEQYGAVFLIGIGGALASGNVHDGRAADYDDWSSPTHSGYKGLNGDILLWHPKLQQAVEVSSMGIRVDRKALLHQLNLREAVHRKDFSFHQQLLQGKLPQTIGGGIGQSRLAMFLLQEERIERVQYCLL